MLLFEAVGRLVLLALISISGAYAESSSPSSSPTASPTQFSLDLISSSSLFGTVTAGQASIFNVSMKVSSAVTIRVDPCSASSWLSSSPSSFNASGHFRVHLQALVPIGYPGLSSQISPTDLTDCANIVASSLGTGDVLTNTTIFVTATVRVPCEAGLYSSSGTNYPQTCQACPIGSYSALPLASSSCTACPQDRPLTQATGSPSLASCTKCPLGSYCPLGSSPQPCPASGGYEPYGATLKDRNASDCVVVPCQQGYWCGAGAAEGSTYVQNLAFDATVTAAAVLGQSKTVSLPFQNVFGAGGDIFVKVNGTVPSWLTLPANFTITPLSSSSPGSATMDSNYFKDSSSDLYGTEQGNATVTFEWFRASDPTTRFSIGVLFDFTLVTVIVTPSSFVYSASEGSQVLSPPIATEIDVFNTMCNYSVSITIQAQSCSGEAFPPWLSFVDSDPFSTKQIEEQAGLPTVIKYNLDSTQLQANATSLVNASERYVLESTPPSVYESTCIRFDFVVNDVGIAVSRLVDVDFRLLRPCPPGTFSLTGDDSDGCNPCPLDSYQTASGSTFCTKCSDTFPRTRHVGTISSDDCLVDSGRFKYSSNQSEPCPQAAVCDNEIGLTTRTISVRSGYWRASPNSLQILQCPRPLYCRGGTVVSPEELAEAFERRRLIDVVAADLLYVDNQCISNHTGPYCYNCVPGAIKRTVDKICSQCTSDNYVQDRGRVAGLFFLFSFLALGVIALMFFYTKRFFLIGEGKSTQLGWEKRVSKIFAALDLSIPLQIFVSFLQVVSAMSGTFSDVLPPFYAQLRQIFSLLALDLVNIIDFGCALSAQNHFASLLLSTLMPMLFIAVVFSIGYVLQRRTDQPGLKQEFRNTTFTMFLVTAFLVYPSCSNSILATFVCQTLDDGVTVLTTDPSIDCTSPVYYSYRVYAIFMIFVYPVGIPALYSYLLYKERNTMYRYYSDNIKLAVAMRSNNKDIRYLKFLWRPYKPAFFFFEVFELVRKLAQTSIVVFIAPGSSPQIVFQLLTTVVSVVVLNSFSPYLVYADALLAIIAQWTLFGISLTTLLIKFNQSAQLTSSGDYNQDALNVLLTALFFTVPIAAIIRALSQILGEIAKLFYCIDFNEISVRYKTWRGDFLLENQKHRRRKSLAMTKQDKGGGEFPELNQRHRRKTISMQQQGAPGFSVEKKTSMMEESNREKLEVVDEAKLMETEQGAIHVIELLKERFAAIEKDILLQVENERKENEELLQERTATKENIQTLENRLQDMKIKQIEQKEEELDEKERERQEEEAAHGGRRKSFMAPQRRATLMNAIRLKARPSSRVEDVEAGEAPRSRSPAASETILASGRKSNPEGGEVSRKVTGEMSVSRKKTPLLGGDHDGSKGVSGIGGIVAKTVARARGISSASKPPTIKPTVPHVETGHISPEHHQLGPLAETPRGTEPPQSPAGDNKPQQNWGGEEEKNSD